MITEVSPIYKLIQMLCSTEPLPSICPIEGGGIQFEWGSDEGKYLELEILDDSTILFIQGDDVGKCSVEDRLKVRELLEWAGVRVY